MGKNRQVAPVVKWVGGKRQLLEDLIPLFPKRISSYCEPFLGGGAVLFQLQPKVAYVNDINFELIQMYEVIRDHVEELITALEGHPNEEEHFYFVRDYKKPNIVNAVTLRAVSRYFQKAQITFTSIDYEAVLSQIQKGTFVYLDPPYDPVSDTANFTGYAKGGFGRSEQIRLRECCDALNQRGIKFLLSNSATDFIKEQYHAYQITVVKAKRAINSNASGRGHVDEVIIRNYR